MSEYQRKLAPDGIEAKPANGKLERLLNAMPRELRHEMEAIWERQVLPVGAVVIEDGQEAERIGYVLDGLLVMVKRLSDGRRHIIGLLTPCDMYGRAFNGASGYRVEALTETEVLSCDRRSFEALISRSAEAERLFLLGLLDELDAAREWVIVLGGTKIVQRLASLILILSRHKFNGASGKPTTHSGQPLNLHLHLKRQDIAHFLGTSPETLSRSFTQLQDERIIRINTPYNIDVLDVAKLTELSGNAMLMEKG